MKTATTIGLTFLITAAVVMYLPTGSQAQTCEGHGKNFVDLDGDGFNDKAPDHDGDGIPNGLDPDYVKNPQDGSSYQYRKAVKGSESKMAQKMLMTKSMMFYRLRAGTCSVFRHRLGTVSGPNGPSAGAGDGTGGAGPGNGICDGTGPHGNGDQGGK